MNDTINLSLMILDIRLFLILFLLFSVWEKGFTSRKGRSLMSVLEKHMIKTKINLNRSLSTKSYSHEIQIMMALINLFLGICYDSTLVLYIYMINIYALLMV